MGIQDEIMEFYNDFICETGKTPNILRIPGYKWAEFEDVIQKSEVYRRPDPLGKVKHWWFMGMRVFNEYWSYGVEWNEETEELKLCV